MFRDSNPFLPYSSCNCVATCATIYFPYSALAPRKISGAEAPLSSFLLYTSYLPFSKPLPLEGFGEAVTRTSCTPPCFSILRGSLAATVFVLCSQGTSVARRSPSGVAVAGRWKHIQFNVSHSIRSHQNLKTMQTR